VSAPAGGQPLAEDRCLFTLSLHTNCIVLLLLLLLLLL
jgi:hypothetical protein